jgi:hypothetical protein
VLLSRSPATPQTGPQPGLGIAAVQAGNAVTVDATPIQAPLAAGTRDPFTQQKLAVAASKSTTAASGTKSTGRASTGGASVSTGSTSNGAATGSTSTGSSTRGSTGSTSGNGYYSGGSSAGTGTTGSTGSTGSTRPAAPSGLRATEAYHVSVSITNKSGGVNPIDPFQRDGALPSDQRPLLVELGVAQGAHRVLFAVQPGSVVSGPGSCTPGPLDCELMSLAPGQTEGISTRSTSGSVPVAMFQITGISADRYGSAAAAAKARATTDARGRRLLAHSASATLSLFQYDPSLDAVVDERNLTVGGN